MLPLLVNGYQWFVSDGKTADKTRMAFVWRMQWFNNSYCDSVVQRENLQNRNSTGLFQIPINSFERNRKNVCRTKCLFQKCTFKNNNLNSVKSAVDSGELGETFQLAQNDIARIEFLFAKYKYGIVFLDNQFCLFERNSFYQGIHSE